MRLCMVTNYCKPHIGGIETLSFEQAMHLVERGHHVTIVSSQTDGDVYDEEISGIRIKRVRAFNFLEERFGIPYPLFCPRLATVLREELSNADVCIIHSFGFMSSLVAAILCCILHVPYLLYQHNSELEYSNPILNIAQRINELIAGRFILDYATKKLALSESTQNYLSKLGHHGVEVLYPGVSNLRFSATRSRQGARDFLELPLHKFIVLTVRRLVFKNSVDTLLEVANILRDDSRIMFVVVGDGQERANLEKSVQRHSLTNCILAGCVSDELLPNYYYAADLFVLSSRTGEGLGLVVLEAMAAGLAVIATKGGGQVEVVQDSHSGILVDPLVPHQIADQLSSLLEQPERLGAMGQYGRRIALEQFSWDTHIERLLMIVEQLANDRRAPS